MRHYFFDIGGVLIQYEPGLLAKKIADKANIKLEAAFSLFDTGFLLDAETGKIGSEEFFRNQINKVLKDWTYQGWIQEFSDHYLINKPGMNLFLELKKNGYRVYLLSNLAEYHKIAIEMKYPEFFTLADINFLSYEIGLHKPNIEIYQYVFKRIKTKPRDCIFIDDILENVQGAQSIGMIGIHYSNKKVKEIKEMIKRLK